MNVAVVVGFSSYWGTHLKPNLLDATEGPTVGGGEEAAIRAAVELKALGHDADLWWYAQPGEWRGVRFYSLFDDLHYRLRSTPYDAVVSFSDLRALEWAPKSAHGRRFFAQQLNDLWNQGDWSAVDCIISPSERHGQQLAHWGWREKPYGVVYNGCDLEVYRHGSEPFSKGPSWNNRPMNIGYWSSPDRGLHHLLAAWPEVLRAEPTAKLHVFYEIDKYLALVARAVGEYGARAQVLFKLLTLAKQDKSVVFHGQVPRLKLAKTQLQCRVMCYPYDPVDFCEGFGGSVNQAIAAGCYTMLTPKDAFPELYDGVVEWLRESPMEFSKTLAPKIIAALHGGMPGQKELLDAAAAWTPYTWAAAGKQLEAVVQGKNWKVSPP